MVTGCIFSCGYGGNVGSNSDTRCGHKKTQSRLFTQQEQFYLQAYFAYSNYSKLPTRMALRDGKVKTVGS